MIVAIVGTTNLPLEFDEVDVRKTCANIITMYDKDTIIISGGATGVDKLAIEVSKGLGYNTQIYAPGAPNWTEYQIRNIKIAKACDQLFCITTPTRKTKCYHHSPPADHEKTAGCWTLNQAEILGKITRLIII